MKSTILLFDIEILSFAFGDAWQTMASNNSSMISFGWKWEGESKAHCIGLDEWPEDYKKDPWNDKNLVKEAHKIISRASGLVAHYGNKFDVKYCRSKFMEHGLDPQVMTMPTRDTCLEARKQFKLSSNRLNNLATFLKVPLQKDKMTPLDWFKGVARSIPRSMKKMNKYCKQDVEVLDSVYSKMRTLFTSASWPNAHLVIGGHAKSGCPDCGTTNTRMSEPYITKANKRWKFKCYDCGKRFCTTLKIDDDEYNVWVKGGIQAVLEWRLENT